MLTALLEMKKTITRMATKAATASLIGECFEAGALFPLLSNDECVACDPCHNLRRFALIAIFAAAESGNSS